MNQIINNIFYRSPKIQSPLRIVRSDLGPSAINLLEYELARLTLTRNYDPTRGLMK